MADNMRIYRAVENTPADAKKTIKVGRLNGFTDINPMYRIKMLTERFGPCGIGWYTEIIDRRTVAAEGGVVMCFVDLALYYREDPSSEWSKPVFGTGGNTLVAKESKGLYANDEGWKMAYTDALSIACKALGMCADVYYQNDYGKYTSQKREQVNHNARSNTQPIATPAQIQTLLEMMDGPQRAASEAKYGHNLVNLPASMAGKMLQKLKEAAS